MTRSPVSGAVRRLPVDSFVSGNRHFATDSHVRISRSILARPGGIVYKYISAAALTPDHWIQMPYVSINPPHRTISRKYISSSIEVELLKSAAHHGEFLS